MTHHSLLCFGMGFSGRVLATRLLADGWTVHGTSRSAEGCAALAALGVTPWQFDGTTPLPPQAFDGVTHVLSSVPPGSPRSLDDDSDPVLTVHRDDLLADYPLRDVYKRQEVVPAASSRKTSGLAGFMSRTSRR